MRNMAIAFGSHMAMRMAIERDTLAHCTRGPGLPSSHLGLALARGDLDEMRFTDFLGDERPGLPASDVHTMFEEAFGV